MKVLIVDKTGGVHSGQERTRALASAIPGDVHLLAPTHWIESGQRVTCPDQTEGFATHLLPVGFNGNFARGFYHGGIASIVRDVRPDLIQLLEEPWSFFAWQGMRARCRHAPKAPLVLYTWENIYRDFRYPSRLSAVYALIEKRVYPETTALVCATPIAADVARRKGFSGRMEVVTYGIDDTFFAAGEARRPGPASARTVGYVGRFLEMKGIETLVEAAAGLDDVHVKLLGSGPDEERLRRLVSERDIATRVKFLPSIPVENVAAFMAGLDVLVLPSRTRDHWAEQLGRVLPEAMAAGTPVIGSDSGCIPWVIGDAGLVFHEGDAADLKDKIRFIFDSDATWRDYSDRGRRRSLERFTWRRFATDLSAFYRELLS